MSRSALLNVMVSAVNKAARIVQRDFGEVENLQVAIKGPADFVTAADRKVEEILREELERVRPGYSFLLEEGGEIKGTDATHRWIIDPIDGTTNFIHGIPQVCISVALERSGTLVAGVVYNPITNELFVAERGAGAYMNNRRLRVAPRHKLEDAVITCGIPHRNRGDHVQFARELMRIQTRAAGIRRTGSAALDLAYVAAGRFDGYWERGLSVWDIAAGILLVREAGGFVGDLDNKADVLKTGNVVAGNDDICGVLKKEIKAAQE
ncbi:MAG: inositol monophosphatase family protein [Hyphomicrobiales bacterium]